MSDTKTDEATKTYTPERQAGEWMPAVVLDEQAERIVELERREALLTAFASAFGAAWTEARFPSESPVEEHIEKLNVLRAETYRRFDALTEAGFPWPTEPVDAGAEAGDEDECLSRRAV